jgi:hypothetical protein
MGHDRSDWVRGTLSRHRAWQVGTDAARGIAVHKGAMPMFSVWQVPRARGRETQSITAHPGCAEHRSGADAR